MRMSGLVSAKMVRRRQNAVCVAADRKTVPAAEQLFFFAPSPCPVDVAEHALHRLDAGCSIGQQRSPTQFFLVADGSLVGRIWSRFSRQSRISAGHALHPRSMAANNRDSSRCQRPSTVGCRDEDGPAHHTGAHGARASATSNLGKARHNCSAAGHRLSDPPHAHGNFVAPTFLRRRVRTLRIVPEEIFGPMQCGAAFDTEEDAVRLGQ